MNNRISNAARSIRKTEIGWRYGANLLPTMKYQLGNRSQLSRVEGNVVDKLNTDGIAITSVDELFGSEEELLELESEVSRLLDTRRGEIERLRKLAENKDEIGSKTFNLELLGSELSFDPESVLARFALHTSILNIADAYFRMGAKLRYYNVWKTFASSGPARESQLWHYDREDNYILKLFLYLDEVDDGAGPFTYALGTHKKGRYRSIDPEYFIEGGVRRTTDDQMKEVLAEDGWVRAVGRRGTVIFADTRGYHKGGEARSRDRLMYTSMYTSPASQSKILIKLDNSFDRSRLNSRQCQALGSD